MIFRGAGKFGRGFVVDIGLKYLCRVTENLAMSKHRFSLLLLSLFALRAAAQLPEIPLEKGLTITESCRVVPLEYSLDDFYGSTFTPPVRLHAVSPTISIEGDNITVDFQNALLHGSLGKTWPSEYAGLGLLIKGNNIKVSNLRVRGFKVAVLADSVTNLTLENCDFSYNFRQRLRSSPEREDFSDWLSHHNNERDQWLRYGAAIYLKNCKSPTVRNCRATGGQNALLMSRCTDGLVMNNTFQFNSGIGIGLYRSSRNRLMHNKLDWSVRGYSHGKYQRGQDSAGILVYEQSNENTIAYNSATHCGDGLFLWAGQSTMDTGKGGCNDNIIFGNDFSHAPTNGIEATFSRNRVQGNLLRECTYGIWGGYSYNSVFMGNLISECQTGIAIEHGQDNIIRQNLFSDDTTGISLWARDKQPDDWAYAKNRDVRSRDCTIDRNVFLGTRKPLKISNSQNVAINGENLFSEFERLLETPKPNENLKFLRNELYGPAAEIAKTWAVPDLAPQKNLNFSHPEKEPSNPYAPLETPVVELKEPDSLPGGMNAGLPKNALRGREWIVMDEFGPYDFRRPKAWLTGIKTLSGDSLPTHTLQLYFPAGAWHLVSKKGVAWVSDTVGSRTGDITFRPTTANPEWVRLEFEFRGRTDWVDENGQKIAAAEPYRFEYQYFKKKMEWTVEFFNYDKKTDFVKDEGAFEALVKTGADDQLKTDDLYFAWWSNPAQRVGEDYFATRSTAEFEVEPGTYKFELTADDGARLFLDGERVLNNWRPHTDPETDENVLTIRKGKHKIVIEHYEVDGFSTLDFRLTPVR